MALSRKHFLVTGGAGFIGSHIADLLIAKGYAVTILDNLSTGKKQNVNSRAKFVRGDIRDQKLLTRLLHSKHFFAVSHQAAHASVQESMRDPVYDADQNILGSVRLFQACADAHVKRIVFASTGGALYGDTSIRPTPESHPTLPLSPYGISKLSTEHYLRYFHETYTIDAIVLRYSNVYGPRQDPFGEAGVVAIFSERLVRGIVPVINGTGKQTRDYVYVSDVARANFQALTLPRLGSATVNIGTGKETSVQTLYRHLAKAAESTRVAHHGPAKREQKTSCLNPARAKKILRWKSSMSLPKGLQATYQWFFHH